MRAGDECLIETGGKGCPPVNHKGGKKWKACGPPPLLQRESLQECRSRVADRNVPTAVSA